VDRDEEQAWARLIDLPHLDLSRSCYDCSYTIYPSV